MLRPTYAITLGATGLSTQAPGPLDALVVERAQNAGADLAVLTLGRAPEVAASEGDAIGIELGWDGATTLVFTGEVEAVERRIDRLEVACAGGRSRLARTRGNQVFVRQSAGQVVSALAADAGVDMDTIRDGVQLPVYVADSGRSHHAHCLRLARWCGFDLYATDAGALVFGPFTRAAPDHSFRYGADVLSASVERSPAAPELTVVPESPASSQGDDTASWLIKDPSPHAGGAGTAVSSEPALRTKDAATAAADAHAARAARATVHGRIELVGAPQVMLGDAVALEDMPDGALDATYQVLTLRHVLDRRRGFRTFLEIGGVP